MMECFSGTFSVLCFRNWVGMIITPAWSVFLIRPPRECGDEYKLAVMTPSLPELHWFHSHESSFYFLCLDYHERNANML